jgi:DNA-binding GntR family transcriptional regulator
LTGSEIRNTVGGIPNARSPVVSGLVPLTAKLETIGDMVYEALLAALTTGMIPLGGQLSEASLASQLNVSKTPVREALLRLKEIGLVTSVEMRGLRVVERSEELLQSAFDVRGAVEAGIARLAAERAEASEAKALVATARESIRAAQRNDVVAFRELDGQFHTLVAQVARNQRLAAIGENASLLTRVLRERFAPSKGDATACGRAHLQIAEAVRSRDSQGAGDAAFSHVRFVQGLVQRALSPDAETMGRSGGGDGAAGWQVSQLGTG